MAGSDLGRPCAGCRGTWWSRVSSRSQRPHFDALGVRLPRKEETEEYAEHAYPHVAVQKSLFEHAWDKESEVRGSFDVLWQGALGW